MHENANLYWLRNRDLPALLECQSCGRRVSKEADELARGSSHMHDRVELAYVERHLRCSCGLKVTKLMVPRRRVDADLFLAGMNVDCLIPES